MILTVIGDPHAKPDNLNKIETLFDIIEDLGNTTIFLGDLLDTKEMVRGKCMNTYLKRMRQSKLQFLVLVGNHDWFNLECKEHSLEALKLLPNVRVIDRHHWHEGMTFIPYMHDMVAFKEALKKVPKNSPVFCHADIKGFDYGNGLISCEGLEESDFKGIKRVISGHYHKYQESGHITYLGTPFSHSFGETDQEKFIGIYDYHKDELELIPSPFPQHRTITIDCSVNNALLCNLSDINRVILTGTQEEIDRFSRFEGVKYLEQPVEALTKTSVVKETDSAEVQFSKWATEIKGYSQEIVDLGLEVLKNV